jgi:hypothetical protein
MRSAFHWSGLLVGVWLAVLQASPPLQPIAPSTRFAAEVARLSEPEGTFDTDNLISNEREYLKVVPALIAQGVSGGVYLGVGPDQNFSYIARIRPAAAYIIDIRRDNLLLHLLFKALFARSTTRVEYLSLLTGRRPPTDLGRWKQTPLSEIVAFVGQQEAAAAHHQRISARLRTTITQFGVPLSTADFETIDRFHGRFVAAGLNLRFQSHGRPPRPYYPTFRQLLLATDDAGTEWNYLAREDDFQFVKSLQARHGVVPVVGDVAGDQAMPAIAAAIARQGRRVSAFYISNVETYIYRHDGTARFVENVRRLPHDSRSVIIRSIFTTGGSSTSVVEPFFAPAPPR